MSGVSPACLQLPSALYFFCIAENITQCAVFLCNVFDCCGRLKSEVFDLGCGDRRPVYSTLPGFRLIPMWRANS